MDIERRMGQRRDSWWISSEGWVRGGIAGGYRVKDGSEEG